MYVFAGVCEVSALLVDVMVINVLDLGRRAEDELTLHMSAQTGLAESEAAHCPRHVHSP